MFHFIASTGRTATTFLAAFLDRLDGVTACHEGYVRSDKSSDPVLELINLENALCYRKSNVASAVVAEKRNPHAIENLLISRGDTALVDIAYYNPMIADALLASLPDSRMVAIIRDCASFVRSATCISGEDPLPVGWPAQDKPLTEREKFIGMGRIKPQRGSEAHDQWKGWSAICRNIWLWQETNRILLQAVIAHPQRSLVLDFQRLKSDRDGFLQAIMTHLSLPEPQDLNATVASCTAHQNSKPSGYQIPAPSGWTAQEQEMLSHAQQQIDEMIQDATTH